MGSRCEEVDIPADMIDLAYEWRKHLIEETASYDENLLEKFVSEEDISEEELRIALRKGCLDNTFIPMFCGSAFKNKGVQRLLDAVVDFLPSPIDIGAVKGTDPRDSDNEFLRKPNIEEPFSALAFKIMTDPYVGKLTYMRVYSGKLDSGSYVYNANNGKKERISRVLLMHSNKREDREGVEAGEIVAAVGLKNVKTGHTLCDQSNQIVLESMDFPDPVVAVSV